MNLYILIIFAALIFSACSNSKFDRIDKILSGRNGIELKKVLIHYEKENEKLMAAEYLIGNLLGNFSYDTTSFYKYRPFLLRYDSLRNIEKRENKYALGVINQEWNQFVKVHDMQSDLYSNPQQDMYYITGDYLIDNIETAFKTWQNAAFKDSIDFDSFLKYVLPYRKKNGYVIESWRHRLLSQYGEYALQFTSPRQLVDSVMNQLNDFTYTGKSFGGYPYLSLDDYLIGRVSNCTTQCWFNSMLFSALGIPCAIDYVLAWGNRNGSHEWNAIVVNGKTYPFEAAGGKGKWKAGKVYNNVWEDEYWMKSRLPKVLRHSYHSIEEGPLTSKKTNRGNTPIEFLNPKYEDVSNEYFHTSDISIPVKKGLDLPDTDFAYLFVFNEDRWRTAYWGEVDGKEVHFKKMGRDIVYLPAFYEGGQLIPFNHAFILQQDGKIHYLESDETKLLAVDLQRKYYMRPEVKFWSEWNRGAQIEVADNRSFRDSHTVFEVPNCQSRPNSWKLDSSKRCRYVRYVFPENKDALAELSFMGKSPNDAGEVKLEGRFFCSFTSGAKEVEKLFDDNILTYADFNGFAPKDTTGCWIGIDFGREVEITAVNICPRNDKNNVIKGMEYELFYWKEGWMSLGKQIASDYHLSYKNVPSNALLLMRCTTEGRENRIFTWNNNTQRWW